MAWAADEPKGEMVVVIAGAPALEVELNILVARVLQLQSEGVRLKDAVAEIAELYAVSKSELYQLALDARKID